MRFSWTDRSFMGWLNMGTLQCTIRYATRYCYTHCRYTARVFYVNALFVTYIRHFWMHCIAYRVSGECLDAVFTQTMFVEMFGECQHSDLYEPQIFSVSPNLFTAFYHSFDMHIVMVEN